MQPSDLKPEQFGAYPPLARKLAADHIATLRKLPLSFLPSLLRDNYEMPFFAPEIAGNEFELEQLRSMLKLSVNEFKARR